MHQRLQREVAGEQRDPLMDPVLAARCALLRGLGDTERSGGREPSAVFLLGGVDRIHGPALYQIESEGATQRAQYAALGSGSLDAIAVLETKIDAVHRRRMQVRQRL
jgi:20S proteasome alpha/beta subunit